MSTITPSPDAASAPWFAALVMRYSIVNEVVPKTAVYDRARAIAEQLAAKPQLFLRYTTLALRQRLLQRLNEGTQLGMALEGLTAADLAYQRQKLAA